MSEQKAGWHVDKTISAGHILSTVVIAISVFTWASAVDRRIEKNAQSITHLTEKHQQNREMVAELRAELRVDLRGMNQKLDRIIERQAGN